MNPPHPQELTSTPRFEWLHRALSAMIVLFMIPSWLGLAGGWHWMLDLLSHFRWQYLILCVPCVLWAAWRRRKITLPITGATLLLNATLIGQLAWHPGLSREAVSPDFKLRVLSVNVLTSNPHKQAVLDHVLASEADIIFFMEVNQGWMTALLQGLREKYPHNLAEPRSDNFGAAIFSKIPWTKENILWLGKAMVPSLEVQITHAGRDFVLIGTHPLPPVGREYATHRDQQLRELASHVAQLGRPALVVGDLNSTPWSVGMRLANTDQVLGFRTLSPAWKPTWRAESILGIPIDHALCTAPMVITERTIGPDVGSDHRSVGVTVEWMK